MKNDNQIPSFITSFVQADRILTQLPDKHDEWLTGAYILFRSFEILLREILSSAQIEVGDKGWTVSKLSQEVLSQANFPPNFSQELREIAEHRNMVAHAVPIDFAGDIFLEDLERIRRLAVWYLHDFSKGPRLSAKASIELLRGDNLILPKVVFISYAKEDQEDAKNLYKALRQRGHKPWMDKRDLIAGQEWESEIRKAIEKADYFVALMSSRSVTKRGFIQKEIRFALDVLGEIPPGRIFFIPARLEPCDVPHIIKRLQWVDLQKDDNYLQIFRAIEHD